ncbi:MAG: hypothetical protein M0C28_41820 [Candidatus Moduliflexus flocculans]|nr:hypothetical protein [Candidatus Moduliflexus flocculans]
MGEYGIVGQAGPARDRGGRLGGPGSGPRRQDHRPQGRQRLVRLRPALRHGGRRDRRSARTRTSRTARSSTSTRTCPAASGPG